VKSLDHLLKVSVTCTNKHKCCCYLPFYLSVVYNELHNVYGWHQWWSLEAWSRSRSVTRDPFFGVSVSKVSSRSRALRLETLHRLFFMKFCKEFLEKTVLKNDSSKFSSSKRSVGKLSLLLCCLRDGENNLPSTPFKNYTEFNKKCACTKETAAHNLCSERLGVLC